MTIGTVDGSHHPLVEQLDDRSYDAAGSPGQGFVNLRGTNFDHYGTGIR
ncbi:MAG: hypothetical protein M3Q65_04560 [Chloroflexota bacterium]|nr:hypothetical protein [Chloroflexota bacterium]